MIVPILTEDQFQEIGRRSTGYVVDVVSSGPCTVHRAGCNTLEAKTFRARVLVNRGRAGGYLFAADVQDALTEAGTDARSCPACLPTDGAG